MKIALIGYGKMGKLVEQEAIAKGHSIQALYSAHLGIPQDSPEGIVKADVVIDFSHSSAVISNLELCLFLGKPILIGTTGWEKDLPEAQSLVAKSKGSCLYAPNFSIGVYLYQQILNYAAALFQNFGDYDASGLECHHRQKADSPSGTAKEISRQLQNHMPRLNSFDFSSVRCGSMPGTHTVYFDSPVDTLSLTHQARTREGFAKGALMAAEWLRTKKGFFSLEDMMQEQLQGEK